MRTLRLLFVTIVFRICLLIDQFDCRLVELQLRVRPAVLEMRRNFVEINRQVSQVTYWTTDVSSVLKIQGW